MKISLENHFYVVWIMGLIIVLQKLETACRPSLGISCWVGEWGLGSAVAIVNWNVLEDSYITCLFLNRNSN